MMVLGVMVNWQPWSRTTVDGDLTIVESGQALTVNGNPTTVRLDEIKILLADTMVRTIRFEKRAGEVGGAAVRDPDYANMKIGHQAHAT